MGLNGFDAHVQLARNLTRLLGQSDQFENLQFSITQKGERRGRRFARSGRETSEDLIGNRIAEKDVATQNVPYGLDQFLATRLFGNVPSRPGAQGTLSKDRLVMHRQNEHRQIRMQCLQIFDQLQPPWTRQI